MTLTPFEEMERQYKDEIVYLKQGLFKQSQELAQKDKVITDLKTDRDKWMRHSHNQRAEIHRQYESKFKQYVRLKELEKQWISLHSLSGLFWVFLLILSSLKPWGRKPRPGKKNWKRGRNKGLNGNDCGKAGRN